MPDGHTVTVLEMEWLDGMTLEKHVAENGAMPVDRVRDIARQVIAGMKHAHAKNVLHLDLKPSNLFLTSEGTVKIIDFGIAKVVGANADIVAGAANVTVVTTSGESAFAGTLAYAAPSSASAESSPRRRHLLLRPDPPLPPHRHHRPRRPGRRRGVRPSGGQVHPPGSPSCATPLSTTCSLPSTATPAR